ncbi:MAG: hypothetical protein FAZ92_01714 [Accumulibacter sp.]|nr:MAG: hypothetical protein FAZ92_01714 [Accumulibacter sp.]
MPGQSLARLTQDLQTRIAEQRLRAAGALESVLDQSREAFALEHRRQVHTHLDASGERRIRGSFQSLRQHRVTDQPDRHQVARIESEVEKGREVTEEVGRQILCLIEDPHRQELLGIRQMMDVRLDLPPQQRPAITRREAERLRQTTIQIEAAEVRLRVIDHLMAMRIELRRQGSQRRRLAHPRLAGQQTDPRRLQQPLEALVQTRQHPVIPQFGTFLAERRMAQPKMLQFHRQSSWPP